MSCGVCMVSHVVRSFKRRYHARTYYNAFKTMEHITQGDIQCVIVAIPSSPEVSIKSDICKYYESLFALTNTSNMGRLTFCGGRTALDLAISTCLNIPTSHPINRDSYGAPILPDGVVGSISHKHKLAVGIAAPCNGQLQRMLGVDIEELSRDRYKGIAKRILTDEEMSSLGKMDEISVSEEVALRFSLKESVFKAAHALVKRHIAFKEVEVYPLPDGTAIVNPLFDCISSDVGNGGESQSTNSSSSSRPSATRCSAGKGWGKWHIDAQWRKVDPSSYATYDTTCNENNPVDSSRGNAPLSTLLYWLTIVDVREITPENT